VGEVSEPIRLVILGVPMTKKTSQQIATRRDGSPFIVSAQHHKKWAEVAAHQLRAQWGNRPPIEGMVHVRALIYRVRATGDLVGFKQAIGDVLEAPGPRAKPATQRRKASVIKNDVQIDSWDGTRRLKDKDNPRVEIEIREMTA
jgi:hypothetical protein